MKNKGEKGITLLALVVTIGVMILLAGMGAYTSTSSIKSSHYDVFKTELKIMQSQVNQITEEYSKENKKIGVELTDIEKEILNTEEVAEQLTKKAEDADMTIEEIQNGFRICTTDYIKETLGIENITRDYLINLEQCIVVSEESVEYEGTTYYMLEQMDDGLYNVTYKDQISKTGNFTITTNKTEEEYKITVTPEHEKYVSKWQIKYKLQDSTYWKTTNNLTFTVDRPGTYEIQVIHKDEIDLGTKTVTVE